MANNFFIFFLDLDSFEFTKYFLIVDIIFNILGFGFLSKMGQLITIFSIVNLITSLIAIILLFKDDSTFSDFFKFLGIIKLIFAIVYCIFVAFMIIGMVKGGGSGGGQISESLIMMILIYFVYAWIVYLYIKIYQLHKK